MKSLHLAARYGDLEKVKILISAGADINARDEDGRTPLICSANYSHVEIAKELIAAGADVNAREEDGKTALSYSVDNFRLDIVKVLIAAGADVNAKEEDGFTPLHINAHKYSAEITKALITAGADVNAIEEKGKTPLHYSADNGDSNIVEVLIAAGADLNAKEEDGRTPLHCSTLQGHSDIVRALIAAGADISVEDDGESTPFDVSSTEMKMVLIKYALLYQYGSSWKPELGQGGNNVLNEFWNTCKTEVEKMNEMWLGNSCTSFFKFITETDPNKLAFYLSEEDFGIENELGRFAYIEKFPTYAEDIQAQFEKGSERVNLVHESQRLMARCFRCTMPAEIIKKISEYMSNDDLESFLMLKDDLE